MRIDPYLFFAGNCEEAIEFYKSLLGAETLMLLRFSESPDPMPEGAIPEGFENKIMHACLKVGDSQLMMTDGGGCTEDAPKGFDGFSLTLGVKDAAEAERLFSALSDGGAVTMPLGKTFFSPAFGMLKDKYGVGWGIVAEPGPQ